MLEERVDPGNATSRELARLCRLVARELGFDHATITSFALAGQLYGLDLALRREVGGIGCDVAEAFAAAPATPGGLNPTLRSVGSRAAGFGMEREFQTNQAMGSRVVRIVYDYLELRAQSDEEHSSAEDLAHLLRASGADAALVDALLRAVEETEGTQVRTERRSAPGD
jgi:hypothetical protein